MKRRYEVVRGNRMKKDYGTNNHSAWSDPCTLTTYHNWKHDRNIGNCYNLERCTVCDSVHRLDSSD